MCKFLRISPPYDTCLAYAPYARNAPHCSRAINRGHKSQVPAQLEDLSRVPVPSRRAARILKDLSSNVVCGVVSWHQNKAPEVYQEWCDDLWNAYLTANELDPSLWAEVTPQLTRTTWEAALEDARQDQQDDSSSEEYDSDEDGYDAYENENSSLERDATPDTTTSSFDESPSHQNSGDQSQTSQSHNETTIQTVSSAEPSRQLPRRNFPVYRDPGVPPIASSHGEVGQARQPEQAGNRRPLAQLDANIHAAHSGRRTSSPWSHETSDAASSIAISHTELPSTSSHNAAHRLALDASQPPSNNEILLSSGEVLRTSEEAAVEASSALGESDAESVVGSTDTVVEVLDTPEEAAAEVLDAPEESVSEVDSHDGSDVEEADDSSQDANNGGERTQISAWTIDGADTDSAQGRIEEISTGHSSPEAEDAATNIDRDEEGITDLLSLDDSLFDDGEVIEVITPPLALVPSHPGFQLYPQASSPSSQLRQLWNTMAQTVSSRRRHAGFIYAFTRPSLPGLLKIGYVKSDDISQPPHSDVVDRRLAEWYSSCGHAIKEVFRVEIPCKAVQRIESLVHLTLRESRWVEDPPCRSCQRRKGTRHRNGAGRGGGHHNEWFEVEEQTARHVVNLWASFAEQLPYDRWGRMVDFWSEKVDEERGLIMQGNTTLSWVEKIPRLIEELRRRDFNGIIGALGR
jgi:hypothetical protein